MTRTRIHPYVRAEMAEILQTEAKRRNVSLGDVVEAAANSYFFPEDHEKREELVKKRLDRLQRQMAGLETNLLILSEALSVFVRAWLTHTPEIPEGDKAAAEAAGGMRYQKFRDYVARGVAGGKTMNEKILSQIEF